MASVVAAAVAAVFGVLAIRLREHRWRRIGALTGAVDALIVLAGLNLGYDNRGDFLFHTAHTCFWVAVFAVWHGVRLSGVAYEVVPGEYYPLVRPNPANMPLRRMGIALLLGGTVLNALWAVFDRPVVAVPLLYQALIIAFGAFLYRAPQMSLGGAYVTDEALTLDLRGRLLRIPWGELSEVRSLRPARSGLAGQIIALMMGQARDAPFVQVEFGTKGRRSRTLYLRDTQRFLAAVARHAASSEAVSPR